MSHLRESLDRGRRVYQFGSLTERLVDLPAARLFREMWGAVVVVNLTGGPEVLHRQSQLFIETETKEDLGLSQHLQPEEVQEVEVVTRTQEIVQVSLSVRGTIAPLHNEPRLPVILHVARARDPVREFDDALA